MRRYICAIILFAAPIMAGCSVDTQGASIATKVQEPDVAYYGTGRQVAAPTRQYALNIARADLRASRFEPADGCYLGVYAVSDTLLKDVFAFDFSARKRHGIYMYHTIAGETPIEFLSECAENGKTPLMTVAPPTGANIYDARLLMDLAQSIGQYQTPVFVNLYPFAPARLYDAAQYAQFWNVARAAFNAYAPNAALVWSCSQNTQFPVFDPVSESGFFQPQADWAGFELFVDILGGKPDLSGLERLKEFYAAMQGEKPIMLFLAVSHFSAADNTYYSLEAAGVLADIYKKVLRDMPRVKAVVYLDFDERVYRSGKNDYTVTGEDAARDAYRNAVGDDRLLTEVSAGAGESNERVVTRAALPALLKEDDYYAPSRALEEAGIEPPTGVKTIIEDGEIYAALSGINADTPINYYVSNDDSVLTIETRE